MSEQDEHARDRLKAQDERVRALGRNEPLGDERVVEVLAEETFAQLLGRGLPRLHEEEQAERDARRGHDVRVADLVEETALRHRPSR